MMDKDYGRWLKEMEADSRAKQEQFMNRIAGRLEAAETSGSSAARF